MILNPHILGKQHPYMSTNFPHVTKMPTPPGTESRTTLLGYRYIDVLLLFFTRDVTMQKLPDCTY